MKLYIEKEERSMYKLLLLAVMALSVFACGDKTEDTADKFFSSEVDLENGT